MPERILTEEEHKAVKVWIREHGIQWAHGFNEGIIGSGVYQVDSEPLVIHGVPLKVAPPAPNVRYSIICSERHASLLEVDGVIRFLPEPQQGASTP